MGWEDFAPTFQWVEGHTAVIQKEGERREREREREREKSSYYTMYHLTRG